jgi:predicted tellurium resistance membrane protein TerC
MFGYQATNVLIQKRFSIKALGGWLLVTIGAFLMPAGLFNLRGWWILATPPLLKAWVIALGLMFAVVALKLWYKRQGEKP